jgi:hypothetical protein
MPLDSVHNSAYNGGMKDLRIEILKKMKKGGLTINQVANLPKIKGKIPRRTVYAYLSGEKDSSSKIVSRLLDAVGLTITTKGTKTRSRKEQKK